MRLIEVVPYDPHWRVLFEREASELVEIFGAEIVAIHHVGSTAIPNMSAKPIIDVLVEVRCIERVDDFNQEMIDRGYLPKGEFGISGRRFFIKGDEEQRSHHIHVFQMGNPEFERHLAFRDYMIAHPEEAKAYSRLKEELALKFPHDIEGYMAGKDDFIKEVEGKARVWKKRR
jgi:GrpB-like predicted nucleotidyltransferase (UPF0157 family)